MFTPLFAFLFTTPFASPPSLADIDALWPTRVLAVAHAVSLDDDVLTVHTTVRHRVNQEARGPLWFTHALPAGSTVNGSGSAPVLDDEQRLTGVALAETDEEESGERVSRFVFRVPHTVPSWRLHVPLFGAPLERIALTGIAFTPDAALALEPRLGHTAPAHVSREDRRFLERVVGEDAPHGSIYVTPEVASRGLVGSVERVSTQRRRTAAVAMTVAIVCALSLALLYRKLSRAALAERVEKVLDGTLDALP